MATTLKEIEETKISPVDEWAEEEVQKLFALLQEQQANGILPQRLCPCEIEINPYMDGYRITDAGVGRINEVLKKQNEKSLLFYAQLEWREKNILLFCIKEKLETPAKKELEKIDLIKKWEEYCNK